MKHKLAECPRTWHSLWDEMFSALAASAFDADSEHAGLGFGPEHPASDETLEIYFVERNVRHSNDNGSS